MKKGSNTSTNARRMLAAVVEHFDQPLVLRELDTPVVGPGQIIVETEACGVCRADLEVARGNWRKTPTLPFIPGHEAIGIVTEVGAGVKGVKEGDRVGVPWLYTSCGRCDSCRGLSTAICPNATFSGCNNGGFAEYILADAEDVIPIPKGLTPIEAAPLICAGVSVYRGLKQTAAQPGEWVALSGFNTHGPLAVQYAKAMGLLVCVIDHDDKKLAYAQALGADVVVNASDGDPIEDVKKVTGGGSHGVLITNVSPDSFARGFAVARNSGVCVLVGLPLGTTPQSLFSGVARSITIRGSFAGGQEDVLEAFSFAVDRRVRVDVELKPLPTINETLDRIDQGEVSKHVVLDFGGV